MKRGDIFGFTIFALGVGILAGILIAPKSGKKTRKDLSEKLEKGVEEISDFVTYESGRVKAKFSETIDCIKSKLEGKC